MQSGSSLRLLDLVSFDCEKYPHLQIPLMFHKCLSEIERRGLCQSVKKLFVESGTPAEVQALLIAEDPQYETVEDVRVITAVLKVLLSKLHECLLLPRGGVPALKSLLEIDDPDDQVESVRNALQEMEPVQVAMIMRLFKLLHIVDSNASELDTECAELAEAMAPCLIYGQGIQVDESAIDLVSLMIEEYHQLFNLSHEIEFSSEKVKHRKIGVYYHKIMAHKSAVMDIVVTNSCTQICSVCTNSIARVWDAQHHMPIVDIDVKLGRVLVVRSMLDKLWFGCEKGVALCNASGHILWSQNGDSTTSMVVVQDNVLAMGTSSGDVTLLAMSASGVQVTGKFSLPSKSGAKALAVCGTKIFVGGEDGVLYVYRMKKKKIVHSCEGHRGPISDICVGEKYVYSCGQDGLMITWNRSDLSLLHRARRHGSKVHRLLYLGNDAVLSGGEDGRIIAWCGEEVGETNGWIGRCHGGAVTVLELVYSTSLGSWTLWSGDSTGAIVIWALPGCEIPPPEELSNKGPIAVPLLESKGDALFRSGYNRYASGIGLLGFSKSQNVTTSTLDLSVLRSTGGVEKPQSAEEQIEKFEINPDELKNKGRSLGSGSFGTVYVAELHGKPVAVKQLTMQKMEEKVRAEFRKEVAVMSSLRHPNVVILMGASTRPGQLLIITELMPRGSVYDLLRNPQESLSFKRRMLFAKDAALGVTWLHRSKPPLLHLDLKAANLLVDKNWRVKVADFGLSIVKEQHGDEKLRHGPIGTPLWMAPEVLKNRPYNEKADVYSFAITLWEMLTGRDPWEEVDDLMQLVTAVCQEHRRPKLPPGIPTRLKNIINACWDPNPEIRPKMGEIVNEFDHVIIDGIIARVGGGRELWRQNFVGRLEVPFKEFMSTYYKATNEKIPADPNSPIIKCLKLVLCTNPDKPGVVTIESFASFADWFGPVNMIGAIERMWETVKQPYFHGYVSGDQASRLVTQARSKGVFLVRFSTTEPGGFALTGMHKSTGQVVHYRISHKPGQGFVAGSWTGATLEELIREHGAKQFGINMKKPCPGSKFRAAIMEQDNLGYLAF